MHLRRPLQVWLRSRRPDARAALALQEIRRAYREYRGEHVVRFRPGPRNVVRKPGRDGFWELTLPAERGYPMDISVFHVGRNGYVWGPGCADRFPRSRVHGLLECWLRGDSGELMRGQDVERWPAPLARLLEQVGLDLEEVGNHDDMVKVGTGGKESLASALLDAMNNAYPYVGEGYAFYRDAVVAPDWVLNGRVRTWFRLEGKGRVPRSRDLLVALQQKHPHVNPRLRDELERDPWRSELLDLTPVRRCWGVSGLFWALLIDQLESSRGF